MSTGAWLPFLIGWIVGWCLIARPRPLPSAEPSDPSDPHRSAPDQQQHEPPDDVRRPAVSIVIPARNEADSLPRLLDRLVLWTRPDDEIIVVDDRSGDATASIAQHYSANFAVRLIRSRGPRWGWRGKPSACWLGSEVATRDTLVFLDADVRPGHDFFDRLNMAISTHQWVSVLPWHVTSRAGEQVSLFPSIIALMGSGKFSLVRSSSRLAFGPVLAFRRATYDKYGGHAAPTVRNAIVEDLALARLVPDVGLYSGAGRSWWRPHEPASVSYRMYPRGARQAFEGWTRTLASGAAATSWWALLGCFGWVWAMAAAPFLGWWTYALAVIQVAVIGRLAGSFRWWAPVVYPVLLVVFVTMMIVSVAQRISGRPLRWKGRRLTT